MQWRYLKLADWFSWFIISNKAVRQNQVTKQKKKEIVAPTMVRRSGKLMGAVTISTLAKVDNWAAIKNWEEVDSHRGGILPSNVLL